MPSDGNDATRLACTTSYAKRIDEFTAIFNDPQTDLTSSYWADRINPLPLLARALRAERYDPEPPTP
jgi:hypothetical protein